jgi:hypothetical protein
MRDSAFLLTGRELVAANLFSRGIKNSGVAAEGIPRIVCGIGSGCMRDSAFLVLAGRELVPANLFSRGIEDLGVAAEGIPRIVRGIGQGEGRGLEVEPELFKLI